MQRFVLHPPIISVLAKLFFKCNWFCGHFIFFCFISHSKYGFPSRKGIIQLFIWHWKIQFLFHFNKNYSITSNTERSISSSQLFPLWFMIAPYCSATSNANVSAVKARIAPRRESCWNSTWWTLVEDNSLILDFQKRLQMHTGWNFKSRHANKSI